LSPSSGKRKISASNDTVDDFLDMMQDLKDIILQEEKPFQKIYCIPIYGEIILSQNMFTLVSLDVRALSSSRLRFFLGALEPPETSPAHSRYDYPFTVTVGEFHSDAVVEMNISSGFYNSRIRFAFCLEKIRLQLRFSSLYEFLLFSQKWIISILLPRLQGHAALSKRPSVSLCELISESTVHVGAIHWRVLSSHTVERLVIGWLVRMYMDEIKATIIRSMSTRLRTTVVRCCERLQLFNWVSFFKSLIAIDWNWSTLYNLDLWKSWFSSVLDWYEGFLQLSLHFLSTQKK
jgi:hypothetical protein